MSGVIELDASGTIVHSTALPLHPPGLIFGLPEHHMLGQHISNLLPVAPTTAAARYVPAGAVMFTWLQPSTRMQPKHVICKAWRLLPTAAGITRVMMPLHNLLCSHVLLSTCISMRHLVTDLGVFCCTCLVSSLIASLSPWEAMWSF
jgi:hypothetical protein